MKKFLKGLIEFLPTIYLRTRPQILRTFKIMQKRNYFNLETDNLSIKEIPSFEMVIATGCIGYIGYKAFSNLFEFIKKQQAKFPESEIDKPIFAFSALRIFEMEQIRKTFDYYGYSLVKTDLIPNSSEKIFRYRRAKSNHISFEG